MGRFEQNYLQFKIIANGAFGQVVYAVTKKFNLPRAVKIVDLVKLDLEEEREQQRNEASFLEQMNGTDFFPKIYETWEEDSKIYIVMELLHLDLQTFIEEFHPQGIEDLRVIYWIMTMALKGLSILHRMKIIHRDIKPENIMISSPFIDDIIKNKGLIDAKIMKSSTIKIIDLGVSKKMDKQLLTQTYTGTEKYLAPEIQKGEKYSFPVDIFALGSCLFYLVTGNDDIQTYEKYKIHQEINKLLQIMLSLQPNQRGYSELLEGVFEKLLNNPQYEIDLHYMANQINRHNQRTVIRFKPTNNRLQTIRVQKDDEEEQNQQ